MNTKTQTKRRVTLSLTPETVQALDAEAQAQGSSRSAALAYVLNEWRSRAARQKREAEGLEAATAAYYKTQSETEQAEDDEWATLTGRAATQAWHED